MTKATIAILALLSLGACDHLNHQQQRALSGGAIGGAAGLGLAAVTGGSLLVGGLVGSAGGAAIGALTKSTSFSRNDERPGLAPAVRFQGCGFKRSRAGRAPRGWRCG